MALCQNLDLSTSVVHECLCNQVVKDCGCLDMQFFVSSMRRFVLQARGIELCPLDVNATADLFSGFRWMNCFVRTYRNKSNEACTKQCQPPCSERVYKSSVSVSGPWPHRAYLDQFYDNYVKGTIVEKDLSSLGVIGLLH